MLLPFPARPRSPPHVEESIFALIPEPELNPAKPPMYRSIHPGQVRPSLHPPLTVQVPTAKKPAATMGRRTDKIDPNQFLKKHERTHDLPPNLTSGFHRTDENFKKPGVPSREEVPVMGLVSQKNYVTSNAVDAILAVPKKTVAAEMDYLRKPDYGRVPLYLQRVREQIDEEYRLIAEMQSAQHNNAEGLQLISEAERKAMLDGLKANWERINKEYQTLSFSVDTPAKKKRCVCCGWGRVG
jgi:hypothetical protein